MASWSALFLGPIIGILLVLLYFKKSKDKLPLKIIISIIILAIMSFLGFYISAYIGMNFY